ncbi:hypothetical protein P9G84_22525 [Brevibacillus centrosporus]|uniref:hypothetical protein n=1 Tax=Brevibacillus centrosporus TaxID=54910 RepID=UPI000F09C0EB|nr:hypothetical protein [Brevibacillus centrosporus]MEC2131705.1 hypothetical protein [Brevibacillus centrosporus]RNB67353.1 hypothetical protein EDM55_20110 [Brevibacillus centrosporus]GED33997.1 hypothetical protein BCE02nite_51380 [Brevibacillus centrosporus]
MICLKGDEVKMKSGEIGVVTETWGLARDWCKLKKDDGSTIITMTEDIESIIKRNRQRGTGMKK